MTNALVERLTQWKKDRQAPPFRATLIITNRCDLNCLFCRGRFSPKQRSFYKDELNEKEWLRVAEEGIKLGIKEWEITGGEPTLRSKIVIGIVGLIKSFDSDAIVTLTTNGSFISSSIAKKLVQLGCDRIEIGIDGPTARIHNFLRGSNYSFKRAINAIKLLALEKKKFAKEKPQIIIKTVLNRKNFASLDRLVLLAHSLWADEVKVVEMRIYDENIPLIEKTKLKLSAKEKKLLPKIWTKVEKIGSKVGIRVEREFTWNNEVCGKISQGELKSNLLSPFCFIPFYSLVIDGVGRVGPCSSIPPSEFSAPPDIRKEGLEKIWYGNFFKLLRECLWKGKPLSKSCESCGLVTEKESIAKALSTKL